MGKFNLKYIKMKAFRSFRDKQEILNLPETGLIGIDGKNQNTGGSSGAGKTSFHLGISYALGYCPFPATELKSWLTEDTMQVELGLSTPKGEVVIGRGEDDTFISINGEITRGIKATDSKIKELIQIPLEFLEALTFRPQKKPGRFLTMTDGDKKEFLGKLLGLQEIEFQIEGSIRNINKAKGEVEKMEAVLASLKDGVEKPQHPEEISTGEIEEKLRSVEVLSLEKEKWLQEQLAVLKRYKDKRDLLDVPMDVEVIDEDTDSELIEILASIRKHQTKIINLQIKADREIGELKGKLAVASKTVEDYIKESSGQQAVEMAIANLQKEIKGIEDNICPTCNRDGWIVKPERLDDLKLQLEIKVATLGKIINIKETLLPKASKERGKLNTKVLGYSNSELNSFKENLEILKAKSEARRSAIKIENLKKINELNDKKQLNIKKLEEEIAPFIKTYNDTKKDFETLVFNKKTLQNELVHLRSLSELNLNNYKERFAQYTARLNKIEEQERHLEKWVLAQNKEMDYHALLKSFLGAILEEVLNEISFETNEMLKVIPNVATTTIQFATETITQKGMTKQQIKPVIAKNGVEIPFRSLSGGQSCSVELAVDLAVVEVLSRRTGFRPDFMILDEPFDGLDVVSKESCLELLGQISKNKAIFIIDHTTEIKNLFDRNIEIWSGNDVSYIQEA